MSLRPATLCAVTPVRSGALMVGLALLLGACGDAENTYVEEQSSGVFVRLPNDWAVFPIEDGKPGGDPRVDLDFGPWRVVIDGAAVPDRAHGEEPAPNEPVGTVQVVPVAFFQDLPLALSSLRMLFPGDGTDPLAADSGVTDVEYREIDLEDHWGSRLDGTTDLGGGPVRVAQIAFFDDGGDRVHLVRILCSLDCFDRNEAEINEILDSLSFGA